MILTNEQIKAKKQAFLSNFNLIRNDFDFNLTDRGKSHLGQEYPFVDIYRRDLKVAGPCGVYDAQKDELIAFYQDTKRLDYKSYRRFNVDDIIRALDRFHYFVYMED